MTKSQELKCLFGFHNWKWFYQFVTSECGYFVGARCIICDVVDDKGFNVKTEKEAKEAIESIRSEVKWLTNP